MACEEWIERLSAHLYDEQDAREREAVERHVAGCAPCRNALAEIAGARAWLAEGSPDVPASRPLVVLDRPSRSGSIARWTAGVAAAAAVLAVGVAIGIATERRVGKPESSEIGVAPARVAELLAEERATWNREVDARIASAVASATRDLATREDLDSRIGALRAAIESGRRDDVDFLLAEIAGVELRSGAALDETARTLRYYALAANPDVTEW